MAIIESLEAEEQASSSSPGYHHYHVFLSFRGQDTRQGFTDYLYRELVRKGYHVFRDDDEISFGKNIQSELQKAIRESKMSIIVFSQDYASSKWCLDELVTIMQRHKQYGHHVLPVFYKVDPSDVRNQRGSFAGSFIRHEEVFKKEVDRVERWREALREAGRLKGVNVVEDRSEYEFLQEIAQKVGNQVRLKVLHVAPKLVGRERDIKDIISWLHDGSDDVGIATICGMGGVGKTTIARQVYNSKFERFVRHCFLEDVRQTKKQNGLVYLQTKLLKALGYTAADSILGVAEGTAMIQRIVAHERVLLVLDDVDDLDQFDALVGKKEWFCSGSKIIITTKLKGIPRAHERDKIFEIMKLNDEKSLELLSWHAFGQAHPLGDYDKCSRELVHYCRGLPLALQVLGSSLSGTTTEVWESELQKLKANPNPKIQDVLVISYESLPDYHAKQLFLHIACFCIGMDERYATRIFDGCGYSTVAGMRDLEDRCLVSIVLNKLTMHQLIGDMAKNLVWKESIENPGKRSRVWDNDDAVAVLTQNTGTETIKGFSLNLLPGNMSSTQFNEGRIPKRRRLNFSLWTPSNNSSVIQFFTKAFTKMQHLQLLDMGNVELQGSCDDIPKSLIWLRCHGSSWSCIPYNLFLGNVAVLEMPNSNLRYIWKGIRRLERLKVLDLRQSHELTRTPNFEGLVGLEILVLEDCRNLVEVDESIRVLVKLESLNLKNCSSLHLKLPVLESLLELDISGCRSLGNLHEVLLRFESLKVLNADGITIQDFKEEKRRWLPSLPWLHKLQLPGGHAHSTCFSSDLLPRTLTHLSLENCGLSDQFFPNDLSCLSLLSHLNLSGNPITLLPESIKQLRNLESLTLENCTKLQSVSSGRAFYLTLTNCISLEKVETDHDLSLPPLVLAERCEKLVELTHIFKLQPVGKLDRDVQRHLGLPSLESLENTHLSLYNGLTLTMNFAAAIQVSQRQGVHSVFLPGAEVPDWFHHRVEGSSILFDLVPVDGHQLIGFSLCLKYFLKPHKAWMYGESISRYIENLLQEGGEESDYPDDFGVVISNRTLEQKCTYYPVNCGISEPGLHEEGVLWLSYWMLQDFGPLLSLEEGDQVEISGDMRDFDVKELGVRLIYQAEGEEPTIIEPRHGHGHRFYGSTTVYDRIAKELERFDLYL